MPIGAVTWSFTEGDFGAITITLQRFLYDAKARSALLVDRSGQLVATVGEPPTFDATAFASLTAADFSANDQLARLIGENDFRMLFHQGERESMYLADIARQVILVVLFDNRTTLGLVRLRMKTAVDDLTRVFEGVFARGHTRGDPRGGTRDDPRGGTRDGTRDAAPPGILAGADDEIDRLFQ
jgi:predicted regulator of Ras-like GTPase activity (Roadblock/LC7/MglB family)